MLTLMEICWLSNGLKLSFIFLEEQTTDMDNWITAL